MSKYVVQATVLASVEVEADTPLDAKIKASDENLWLSDAGTDLDVYNKGDEPMYLRLTPQQVETLTGMLGEYLAHNEDSEVQRAYESLTEFLEM